MRQVHTTDVKKTTMPEVIANAVPDYTQFGRASKLRLNPNKVEDLQWTIPGEFATPETQVSEVSDNTVQEKLSHKSGHRDTDYHR